MVGFTLCFSQVFRRLSGQGPHGAGAALEQIANRRTKVSGGGPTGLDPAVLWVAFVPSVPPDSRWL